MKIMSPLENLVIWQQQEVQTDHLQPSMSMMLLTEHRNQKSIFVKVCILLLSEMSGKFKGWILCHNLIAFSLQ